MIDEISLYALLYLLFAVCVVYPPQEFIAAGLTAENLAKGCLGREDRTFVQYHIHRVCLNIFVHSCLPLIFFLYMDFIDEQFSVFTANEQLTIGWNVLFGVSVLLPILAATVVYYWKANDWTNHPIVRTLREYDDANWRSVAAVIDTEFRRVDKFSVMLGGIKKVIVTDSWVLLVDTYCLKMSQQQDVNLEVTGTDEHAISHHSEQSVQFMNIRVQNTNKPNILPFVIRLNAINYQDLRTKLAAPLTVAQNVIIHQSLDEQFVEAFTDQARANERAVIDDATRQRLDLCLGCSGVTANVKLEKRCIDTHQAQLDHEGRPLPSCRQCYCRPMWCISCMGRWFASRQEQTMPERWMSGKSPCPTCRAVFCVLDVCLTQDYAEEQQCRV